jgi:hypothetical protein
MKKLILVTASLAVLAGCAAPGPNYYGSQAYPRSGDPGGWQVVSVTPVPLGTGARAAAAGETGTTTYSSAPVVVQQQPAYGQPAYGQPVYGQPAYGQPVYVPQPVYAPEPVYQPRYYYPPISIGLGFNFGRGWGHHRGWGGHIGTRFPFHYGR